MGALQEIVRRAMLLVGLRAANIPGPEETSVLLQFIYKKYSGLTLSEIQLAFEKAVAGEFECEANCYENFSCEYFGRIMAAYKKWANQKFYENQMHVVPQTTNLIEMKADWKPLYETYYQDYLLGKLNLRIMPWEIYNAAMECGHMAENTFEDWLEDAKKRLLIELKMELSETFKENEKHDLSERIRKIENGELTFKVTELAKKLSVEFLYKTAQKMKRKQLFVKA